MVISYDHENRNARLSLRQNEILEELANDEKLKKAGGAVPGLQKTLSYGPLISSVDYPEQRRIFPLFTQSMGDTCLRLPRGSLTVTTSRISSKLRGI